MQPNLQIANIYSMEFYTECLIPQDIRDIIQNSTKPKGEIYQFLEVYILNRVSHHFLLEILLSENATEPSFIHFDILLKSKRSAPKGLPNTSEIFEKLCNLDTNHPFKCSADLEFKKKDKRHFIFDLPIKLSESNYLPINEINGFSLNGKIDEQEYSALLWSKENGGFFLTLVFLNEYCINEALAENIIKDVSKITNRLFIVK